MFAVFLERHGGKGQWAAWSVWAGVLGLGFAEDVRSRVAERSPRPRAGAGRARIGAARCGAARRRLRRGRRLPRARRARRRAADCAALRDRGGGFERTAQHRARCARTPSSGAESPRPEHDRGAGLRDAAPARSRSSSTARASDCSTAATARRCRCGWACRSTRSSRSTRGDGRRCRARSRPPRRRPPRASRRTRRRGTGCTATTRPRAPSRTALAARGRALARVLRRPRRRARVTAVLYLSDWTERPAARAPRDDGREEVHPRHEISEGIDHECRTVCPHLPSPDPPC